MEEPGKMRKETPIANTTADVVDDAVDSIDDAVKILDGLSSCLASHAVVTKDNVAR